MTAGRALLCLSLLAACDAGGEPDPRGQPCTADAECGALVCQLDADAPAEDLAPAPLACGDASEGEGPHAACEEASDCDHGLCLLAGGCALPCASTDDCGALERCTDVFARTADDALQPITACVRRVDLPDDAEVRVDERAATLDEGANAVVLEALDGAPTFAILEHSDPTWPGMRCAPPLCLSRLDTSDAETLFDAAADYAVDDPPWVPAATGGHVDPLVLRLPGPGERGHAASYVVSLSSERPGTLSVTRVARAQRGSLLDLDVYYVGALALGPAGERGGPVLAAALAEVDAIFAQAGIAIGRVRQIAITGELPMRGTYFPPEGDESMGFTMLQVRFGSYVELPGLFRLSAGAPGGAVSLFLLSDIAPERPGAEPQAESGGIPGPPAMHGTGGSGIAIATDMLVSDPKSFGRTLAHELAHYLGLFHTSEQDGRVLDDLDDTPECRLTLDADGDGLDRGDCDGHGADNLMFWALGAPTLLTDAQRERLSESPLLR